jgi:hypothetical protein
MKIIIIVIIIRKEFQAGCIYESNQSLNFLSIIMYVMLNLLFLVLELLGTGWRAFRRQEVSLPRSLLTHHSGFIH